MVYLSVYFRIFFVIFILSLNTCFANSLSTGNNLSAYSTNKIQIIDYTPIGDLPFSSFPYNILATVSSGMPLTYEVVSGSAFILPYTNILIGLSIGEVKIKITQYGGYGFQAVSLYDTFNIMKSFQSVVFTDIEDRTFGDQPFELEAKSSSSMAVKYEVINNSPATVQSNVLTIHGAGRIDVKAYVSETDKYQSFSVVNSFIVEKANQEIQFDNIRDKQFGDDDFELYSKSSVGLDIDFILVKGKASILNNIMTLEGAGEVHVKAIQKGNRDYNSVAKINVFNVSKSDQSISFTEIQDKEFGSNNFHIEAVSTSGLPIQYIIQSGNVEFISSNLLKVNGAGDVIIEALQPGDDDYNSSSKLYPFVISKKDQTITYTEIGEREFGTSIIIEASVDSDLDLVYEILSGPATIVGNTISTTGVGVVQVRISQDGNNDYMAVSITKNFAITKRNQVLTCEVEDKIYNENAFSISASSSVGLDVTVEVIDGPCDFREGEFYLSGSGEVTLNIIQAGDVTYKYVSLIRRFYVEKADLEIDVIDLSELIYEHKYNLLASTNIRDLDIKIELISGKAKISGMYITPLSMEDIVIRITQAGNKKYNSIEIRKTYSVTQALGINDIAKLDFICYPNPTYDSFYIEFPNQDIYTVDIISMRGVLMFNRKIQTNATLNINHFNNGVYIIRARSTKTLLTKKIMLNK